MIRIKIKKSGAENKMNIRMDSDPKFYSWERMKTCLTHQENWEYPKMPSTWIQPNLMHRIGPFWDFLGPPTIDGPPFVFVANGPPIGWSVTSWGTLHGLTSLGVQNEMNLLFGWHCNLAVFTECRRDKEHPRLLVDLSMSDTRKTKPARNHIPFTSFSSTKIGAFDSRCYSPSLLHSCLYVETENSQWGGRERERDR